MNDDPLAKIRVIQFMYVMTSGLSAVAGGVAAKSVTLAAGRMLFGVVIVLWLSRQRELSTRAAVVLLGVIPGLWCLSTSAFGLPVFSTRIAWMVLIPTLAAVMYGRAVATWSAVIGLSSLTAVDLFTESTALVVLNAVSGIAILTLVVFVVNGTALRLRATVRQLHQSQADRDRLQHSVDEAGERERAKIATELHDDTIQVMTAATLKLDMARAKQPTVGGKPFDLGEPLELMQEAIARARRLSFDLYPPALDNGLRPALKEITHRIGRDAGFAVELDVTPERFSAEHERLVYRTAKELLENARKHSQAQLVEVTVRMVDSALVLLVADNGRGFDAHTPSKPGDGDFHFGLRAAEERIRRAGGTLAIDSVAGVGTTAKLRLPVTALERSTSRPPETALDSE